MIEPGSGRPLMLGECLEDESDEGCAACCPNTNAQQSHDTVHAITIRNRRMTGCYRIAAMLQAA